MRYRKLRIVWSVVWGLAALLLICLWVRSCWCVDNIDLHNERLRIECGSVRGELVVGVQPYTVPFHGPTPSWQYDSFEPNYDAELPEPSILGFAVIKRGSGRGVWFPHWALLLAMATIATCPWIRYRFTLRTLLLAITLLGVLLGLVVWTTR
jgi:hypothetical protein